MRRPTHPDHDALEKQVKSAEEQNKQATVPQGATQVDPGQPWAPKIRIKQRSRAQLSHHCIVLQMTKRTLLT